MRHPGAGGDLLDMHEPAGPRAAAQNARGGSGVSSAGVPHARFPCRPPTGAGAVACEQRSYSYRGGASDALQSVTRSGTSQRFPRTAWVINAGAPAHHCDGRGTGMPSVPARYGRLTGWNPSGAFRPRSPLLYVSSVTGPTHTNPATPGPADTNCPPWSRSSAGRGPWHGDHGAERRLARLRRPLSLRHGSVTRRHHLNPW